MDVITDVKLLRPNIFGDKRGFFMETFRVSWFQKEVADAGFIPESHSRSAHGVLRGLH